MWRHKSRTSFEDFFARRSSPLDPAAAEPKFFIDATGGCEKWLYTGAGDGEPVTVRAALGSTVKNIILGVSGALLSVGIGSSPGEGTCEQYWVLNHTEVPAGTPFASALVRGGTGDLQLQLADHATSTSWCSAHHCRPWQASDAETAPPAPPAPPVPAPVPPAGEQRPPSPAPPLRAPASPQPIDGTMPPEPPQDGTTLAVKPCPRVLPWCHSWIWGLTHLALRFQQCGN